jgi:hypothetical protein
MKGFYTMDLVRAQIVKEENIKNQKKGNTVSNVP